VAARHIYLLAIFVNEVSTFYVVLLYTNKFGVVLTIGLYDFYTWDER